jgi:hypothetical protein
MANQRTAVDAYVTCAAAIHIKLTQLRQLADDHFVHDPDAVHRGG